FGIAGTGGENSGVTQYALYVDHWGFAAYRSNILVTPNQWTHVALAYDGAQTASFYINGQFAGSVVAQGLYDYNLNTYTIGGSTIGGTTTNASFNGFIDDLAIYNRALSGAEIQQIYNAGGGSKL